MVGQQRQVTTGVAAVAAPPPHFLSPARGGYSAFREAMSIEKRYFTSDLSIRS